MLGRGRGRNPQRGRDRVSQNLDYAQYQEFLEFQKMKKLAIKEDSSSEAGSSEMLILQQNSSKLMKAQMRPGHR